jgi:hypothetical protein
MPTSLAYILSVAITLCTCSRSSSVMLASVSLSCLRASTREARPLVCLRPTILYTLFLFGFWCALHPPCSAPLSPCLEPRLSVFGEGSSRHGPLRSRSRSLASQVLFRVKRRSGVGHVCSARPTSGCVVSCCAWAIRV